MERDFLRIARPHSYRSNNHPHTCGGRRCEVRCSSSAPRGQVGFGVPCLTFGSSSSPCRFLALRGPHRQQEATLAGLPQPRPLLSPCHVRSGTALLVASNSSMVEWTARNESVEPPERGPSSRNWIRPRASFRFTRCSTAGSESESNPLRGSSSLGPTTLAPSGARPSAAIGRMGRAERQRAGSAASLPASRLLASSAVSLSCSARR